ncbi:hypothetical protein ACO2Q3_11380 [Caulobacter sp. KR2-114]|uniref:hypothetical protein n=1 Tax=Caulobacter sp. KR2-114 TaxID=3400912 RepID=UPI003C0600CB
MRLMGAAAAVLGGAALSPAPAVAGVHYVYVPIYTYRQVQTPYQAPPNVELPLEITDAPPSAMEGSLAPHGVVAQHEVRARNAVVLQAPFVGGRREMPAGTVLSQVRIRQSATTSTAWCDLRPDAGGILAVKFDCLGGAPDGSSLYALYTVETDDNMLGVSGDEQPRFRQRFETPVAARPARPEERPTGRIGYEWCGGGAPDAPPKFEVAASFQGGPWEESAHHQCVFGAWSDDHAAVVVDRIRLTLTAPATGKALTYKAEGRAPAGPIARLTPGGPIQTQAEADAQAAAAAAGLREAIVYDSDPGKVAAGALSKGDVLMSHRGHLGVTGVLTADVWRGTRRGPLFTTLPGQALLPAGQVVFGRRVDAEGKAELVWCAPHKGADGRLDKAICLPSDGHGTVAVEARPALMPSGLLMPQYPEYVSPPQVKETPQDLPPLTFTYVFKGWRKETAEIGLQVDWGEGPVSVSSREVLIGPSGGAVVAVPGGAIVLVKGDTDTDAGATFIPAPPVAAPPVAAAPGAH